MLSAYARRGHIPSEIVNLVAPLLDGDSFVRLAQSSKQLQSDTSSLIANNGALVRRWLVELIADRKGVPSITAGTLVVIAWLLKQAATAWGIMTLGQRLGLQGMLLSCGDSEELATCFIQAGARITEDFVVAAAFQPAAGAPAWVKAYHTLGLSTGLSTLLQDLCRSGNVRPDQLQQLSAEQYYQIVAVVLANLNSGMSVTGASQVILRAKCKAEWGAPQVQQIAKLLISSGGNAHIRGLSYNREVALCMLMGMPDPIRPGMEEVVQLVEFAASCKSLSCLHLLRCLPACYAPLPTADIYRLCSTLLRTDREYDTLRGIDECVELLLCKQPAAMQLTVEQVESLLELNVSSSSSNKHLHSCSIFPSLLKLPQAASISIALLQRVVSAYAAAGWWQGPAEELQHYLAATPLAARLQLLQRLEDSSEGANCPTVLMAPVEHCSSCWVLESMAEPAGAVAQLSKEQQEAIISRGVHHEAFPRLAEAVEPQGGGYVIDAVQTEAYSGMIKALESEQMEAKARSRLFHHLLYQIDGNALSASQVEELVHAAMVPGRRDELMSVTYLPGFQSICGDLVNEVFVLAGPGGRR